MMETSHTMPRPTTRKDEILAVLRSGLAQLLELDQSEIDPDCPLLELGADSLAMMSAIKNVERVFGVRLKLRQFYEELSTLDALASWLEQQVPANGAVPQVRASSESAADLSMIEEPSPTEAELEAVDPAAMNGKRHVDGLARPNGVAAGGASEQEIKRVLLQQLEVLSTVITGQLDILRKSKEG